MISISMTGLPPSSNHAYFNLPRGGRVLSKGGKGYKTSVSSFVTQHHHSNIRDVKSNWPYGLAIKLTFEELYNATWPTKAANRYKKVDVSNRVKLLEDALVDSLGIDDSQMIAVFVMKELGPSEMTHVVVWDYEVEQMDNAIRHVRSL